MLQVGDRVYHKGKRANGQIVAIDNTKQKDKYKVMFYWARHVDGIPHGRWSGKHTDPLNGRYRKFMYCSEDNLVVTPWAFGPNKVTSIGGRSLDRLIRNVCEIGRRRPRDDSDIVICYGQSNHRVSRRVFMINRDLIMDKGEQMAILGEDLAPRSWWGLQIVPQDAGNLIIKPKISMGGRGIRRYCDGDHLGGHEYLQEEFKKVREFRAHCFLWNDNPVPFIQEKKIYDTNQLCWNKKQGGRFWYVYQEGLDNLEHASDLSLATRQMITKMSVEALKKLKYDFGGLDFGMDCNGNLKIFEVNSRMGLLEQSLYTYKSVFNELKVLDIDAYQERRWV